jgi:hypothetical protein
MVNVEGYNYGFVIKFNINFKFESLFSTLKFKIKV